MAETLAAAVVTTVIETVTETVTAASLVVANTFHPRLLTRHSHARTTTDHTERRDPGGIVLTLPAI